MPSKRPSSSAPPNPEVEEIESRTARFDLKAREIEANARVWEAQIRLHKARMEYTALQKEGTH